MNKFGKSSREKLDTCHEDLQRIACEVISESEIDFSIVYGHRSPELQLSLYKQGREEIDGVWKRVQDKGVVTNCDGTKVKSKHNESPSMAVDICIYVPGHKALTWDHEHLTYVAGIMMSVARRLLKEGKVSHRLRWGGNWDGDGIILRDQNLWDRPHFELKKVV